MDTVLKQALGNAGTPAPAGPPGFAFDNTYARDLEGLYVPWKPAGSPAPRLLELNADLADELGLDARTLAGPNGLAVFAGNAVPEGAQPLAQAYAGHQFGGFSPQLGDGRALLLGEVIDRRGRRRDLALKGSGRTPFSRGGDGLAAVGPVLREYLMGEAMHALGVPTTRALAAVATGDSVRRETPLPGAILTRVAASHLRVGTFEFFAARSDAALLRRLADYAIARHDPELRAAPERSLRLLQAVVERQASMVAQWMGFGFIHGVMNTDNMTLSGETIDYGPCAFVEHYDPAAVFSSIDEQGRYAFGNQPRIAQWNLARLAESLLPLIEAEGSGSAAVEQATEVVEGFADRFQAHWLASLRAKLGLSASAETTDQALGDDYLELLRQHRIDFTLGFRRLIDTAEGDLEPLRALFPDSVPALDAWLQRWLARAAADPAGLPERTAAMRRANPIYLPRHHRVEAALSEAAEHGELGPFRALLAIVRRPFDERADDAAFAEPAPAAQTACYRTYCGT